MSNYVLVVDDDPNIRSMARMVLESAGHPVTTAAIGAEALQEIGRDLPSAMLLDMQMPVLDGWGVAQRMRELGQWIPTVIMTVAANATRWCAEIGADACLSKPFDIDDLVLAVNRIQTREIAGGSAG